MSLELTNRIAVVGGAAQGIGRAVAKGLRDGGATVHALDIDAPGVAQVATELGISHASLDLSDRLAVARAIADIEHSSGPVDIVVNCTGGVRGQVGRPIEEVDESAWHSIFKANVDSAFWLAQAAGPGMAERGWGRIVTIASGAGLRPSLTGIQAYTAAKHALIGLTKQLSLEFAEQGVTVNSVAPGFILSNPSTKKQWESYGTQRQAQLLDRIHAKRLGRPEDVAAAVLFFASDAASWISGQILSVDGGTG
ncbi:MAG: 3-oxoacyl-[acyl-carrier protein] reductase [Gammaproteobacteria bacterium]|jgi:3-oxoacyl-[acyl-carrier protein] reductase